MPDRRRSLKTAPVEAAPPAPGPADLFGPLFERVQLEKIFPDGKTFADAIPCASPAAILAAYEREKPADRDALRGFVLRYFDLAPPVTAKTGGRDTAGLAAHIAKLWPALERQPETPPAGASLLALPEPYVVPGGRFREIYYWDSYFTMLGLALDGRHDLVEAMLSNFESLIERYGHIPNGTRSYYLSRSQPPFFALMLDLVPPADAAAGRRRLQALLAEHAYWTGGAGAVTLSDGSRLNRYWDDRDTPRDEAYAEDVAVAARSGRAPAEVFRHLRAGAASGWDFSSRWLADPRDFASIKTADIIPIDLNSLLWALEKAIARLAAEEGQGDTAARFADLAAQRAAAIHRYLWLEGEGRFADYDHVEGRVTPVLSAATLYPLFLGLATPAQGRAVARTTRDRLVARGGLRTTTVATGQQWDVPNGWAPLQWIAIAGLGAYGEPDLARTIAERWLATVEAAYRETGKMLEKYDVEDLRPGGGGEYPLQDGFGWTNGVTRALLARYPDLSEGRG
jgi:alpha,alpha-trehalase